MRQTCLQNDGFELGILKVGYRIDAKAVKECRPTEDRKDKLFGNTVARAVS
jgi:hypothetical protein